MAEPVSLRAAAAALGVPKSTLSQLIRRETTLAAAVVGSGARGAMQIDLERLRRAWAALQPHGDEEGLSDRARYDRARRTRLWWDCCALEQQLADREASLADAAEHAAALAAEQARVKAAAAAWAEAIGPDLAGLPPASARMVTQDTIVRELQRLCDPGELQRPTQHPLPGIALPDPVPGLWDLRARLEVLKGELTQLQLRQDRGELLPGTAVLDQFSAAGLQMRDAWQRCGEQLALQCTRLATPESVKTAALQLLSANGLT